jgi:hypothetical protein
MHILDFVQFFCSQSRWLLSLYLVVFLCTSHITEEGTHKVVCGGIYLQRGVLCPYAGSWRLIHDHSIPTSKTELSRTAQVI